MYPEYSEAEVFYTTRIIWAILPVALPLVCTLVWLMIHQLKGVINVQAKIKASITALLYLIWPGLCSETFAMFSCRDVCGESLLQVDLEEKCGVGRHFIYSRYLGIPMLIVYVIGLPLVAFIGVILVRRRAARRGSKIETSKGHLTFGLFYSAYDPNIWWWEITVTFRKIFVAFIGVFGGALGEMQVHLTAYVMFVVILLTAIVQPFGKNKILQVLELITLSSTWMTLWAGSVFNTYPKCQDGKGGELGWCNALSIFIGALNIVAVVAVVVGFIYYKQQERCDACGKKVYGEVVVARRRRTMERRQHQLRQKMGGVDMLNNPYDGERKVDGEGNVESGNEIEMTSIESIEPLEDGWTKEIDESTGNEFFYNAETGESKWVNQVVDESGLLNDANENPLIETIETNSWVKKIDSETGNEYWHNEETDETKWVEEEVVDEEDDLARSENENPLVDKDIHVDPSNGRRYSIDEDTGHSEWVVE
jgi:phosphatidylglycerophosphate synthase